MPWGISSHRNLELLSISLGSSVEADKKSSDFLQVQHSEMNQKLQLADFVI